MIDKLKNSSNTYFLIVYLVYLIHQIYFITFGGTTWDEPASILGGGKQIYKALLFVQSINNPALEIFSRPEFYGPLIFIPAVLITYFHAPLIYFSNFYKIFPNVNTENIFEIALITRHIFLNIYVGVVLYIIFRELSEKKGLFFSTFFLSLLFLVPSFNGHLMFNFADSALAIQFFLASYFYIQSVGKEKNNLFFGILFGITLLTRLNAILFLLTLSFYELIYKKVDKYRFKQLISDSLKIYSIAILILYIFTPSAWRYPIRWLNEAIIVQFNHPNNVRSLINGEVISAYEVPWHYLISWFSYKLPVIYIVCVLFAYILYVRNRRKYDNYFSYSLFLILLLNVFFIILNPVAYDGIRHYLFLIPLIVYITTQVLIDLNSVLKIKNLLIFIVISYLVFTQYGLGPFKYTYLNEFVDEAKITYDCEINIGQPGCGDWETDYWGFGGKMLVRKLEDNENYRDYKIQFCEPQFTYSMFYKDVNNYWELENGQFVFDDQYPFTQDKIFFNSDELFNFIENENNSEIKFLALSYHRPLASGCNFQNMNIPNTEYYCETKENVKAKLRGTEIIMNYLYECTIQKY